MSKPTIGDLRQVVITDEHSNPKEYYPDFSLNYSIDVIVEERIRNLKGDYLKTGLKLVLVLF